MERDVVRQACFDAIKALVLPIFSASPIELQPKYLAYVSADDGALLGELYEEIKTKTARGPVLDRHPLGLVHCSAGNMDRHPSLDANSSQGCVTVSDWFRSDDAVASLEAAGIADPEDILFLQLFESTRLEGTDHPLLGEVSEMRASGASIAPLRQLTRLAQMVSRHGVVAAWMQYEGPGAAQDCQIGKAYGARSEHALSSAQDFLMAAASVGLFPKVQRVTYCPATAAVQVAAECLERRRYLIREAQREDVAALVRLERVCWGKGLRVSKRVLRRRVAKYPAGQLVIGLGSRVVGCIYSHRIMSPDVLVDASIADVDALHCTHGRVIHILSLNIDHSVQDQQLGDQLLEFMLLRSALMQDVRTVVGVTRCKDFDPRAGIQLAGYIHLRNDSGQLVDTVLRMHEMHGAKIRGLVPGYRPFDHINGGHGVLVSYDLRNRIRQESERSASIEAAKPTASATDPGDYVVRIVSKRAQLKGVHEINLDQPLMDLGLDSADLLELNDQISREYSISLPPLFFFENNTCAKLITRLRQECRFADGAQGLEDSQLGETVADAHADDSESAPRTHPDAIDRAQDIAIVGLSGRFPGAADIEEFWENLTSGQDNIREVPSSRWQADLYFDTRKNAPGKTDCNLGGFIEGIDEFDALFFGISPSDAREMDPQERLFLQTVWNLLEEQGYTRESLQRHHRGRVGVYVGSMSQQYDAVRASLSEVTPGLSLSSASGIANRVSWFFDFRGPSVSVDTMCSSSAMAIHLACKGLQSGDCTLAIAGGVNLLLHPGKYIGLSQANLIGTHKDSRSFSDGDGYLPAETVGAVLLKRLSRATADGDRILAVIRSTATNHSGRASGYQVPDVHAQAELIEDNLARANVHPRSISYVEAAASGSVLGDAIEIAALTNVFRSIDEPQRCVIGSVKSSIGHAEGASGISQLAKVVLQLQKRTIVPTIRARQWNGKIDLGDSPFYLEHQLADWKHPMPLAAGVRQSPRRALINSFGAGGSNVSLLVEESPALAAESHDATDRPETPEIVVLSARNAERLRASLKALSGYLEGHQDVSIGDLAFTLQVGREEMQVRWATIASSCGEVIEAIEGYLRTAEDGGVPVGPAEFFEGGVGSSSDVSQLMHGEFGVALLQPALEAKDLSRIARLWCAGIRIPWDQVRFGAPRKIVRLPTYPFEKKRCWIGDGAAMDVGRDESGVGNEAEKHSKGKGIRHPVIRKALARILGLQDRDLRAELTLAQLGLNSISAFKLRYEFETSIGCPVPLAAVAGERTLEQVEQDLNRLGAEVQEQLRNGVTGEIPSHADAGKQRVADMYPEIVPQPEKRYEPFPLTDIQESFVVGRRMGSAAERVGAHIYFESVLPSVDICRLSAAWTRLVSHHEILRTVVVENCRQQILRDTPAYRFKVLDLRQLAAPEQETKLAETRKRMIRRIYDATQWPMFDIRISICADYAMIHFSIDEIIVDATALSVLMGQWRRTYEDQQHELPVPSVSFRDYVLALKHFEHTSRYEKDLRYWMEKCGRLPLGSAFVSRRSTEQSCGGDRERVSAVFDRQHWAALQAVAQRHCVSPTTLLLTLFIQVVRSWSDDAPLSLVLTFFNRLPLHPEIDDILGPFVSTTIFIAQGAEEPTFSASLRSNQRQLLSDLDHCSVSGIKVLRELKARNLLPRAATLPFVFTSLLNGAGISNSADDEDDFGERRFAVNQTPQVHLDHQILERQGQLEFSWDVANDYFPGRSADAIFAGYCRVLRYASEVDDGEIDPSTVRRLAIRAETSDRHVNGPRSGSRPRVRKWGGLDHSHLQLSSRQMYEPFPLTEQQTAFAFARSRRVAKCDPGSRYYQEIDSEALDVKRLEHALTAVAAAHGMLTATFDLSSGQQRIGQARQIRVVQHDFSSLNVAEKQNALAGVKSAMLAAAIDINHGPYVAVEISSLGNGMSRIHLGMDMLIGDARSLAILVRDTLKLYANPAHVLPGTDMTFRDYVMTLVRYRTTDPGRDDLLYWRTKFASELEGPALPASGGEPTGVVVQRSETFTLWQRLRAGAIERGLTPSVVLLTALMEVLWEWNRGRAFTIVVPSWQRPAIHPHIDEVIGDFAAMSWLPSGDMSVSLEQKAQRYDGIIDLDLSHGAVSGLSALRRTLGKRKLRGPLFPVVFTDLLPGLHEHEIPKGFVIGEGATVTAQVYLDSICYEAGTELHVRWDVAEGIYPAAMLDEMFAGYLRMLRLLAEPGNWHRQDFRDVIAAQPQKYDVTRTPFESVRQPEIVA